MHTVSFFSFKGGVGRTNLLLNIAYGLAQRGDFVVIADWDLHAPGFSLNPLFFRPLEEPKIDNDIRPGVLDFLDSALDPDQHSEIIDPKTLAQPTRLGQQDRAAGKFNDTGDIWSIPAGRFDPQSDVHAYDKQLRRVQGRNLADWLIRYEEQNDKNGDINNPHALLQFFRERIEDIRHPETGQAPDWLLIDSRTGMTEIGDLLLHTEFVDRMVLVSGFNEQNLAGIESVIRTIQQKTRPGELHEQLSLVFSPVPLGEEKLKQQRLDIIKKNLDNLTREHEGKSEAFPQILTVPYHPRIALQEEIMLREFPDSNLTPNYRKIIDEVTDKAKRQIDELLAFGAGDKEVITKSTSSGVQKTENLLDILSGMGFSWDSILYSLEKNQQWEMAERAYRRAIKHHPNDARYWNNLGNLLAQHTTRYAEAEQAYREAIQRDDKWAYSWYNLGKLLADDHLQRYAEAEQAYRKAIQRDEKNSHPWNDLGSLLAKYPQRHNEAEQAFRKSIQHDEKNAHPWNNLGNLLAEYPQRHNEAEQVYREAIQRDEKYAHPWNGLGCLLAEHLQRHDEAERAYREAIQCDEKYAHPWNNLGNLLAQYPQRHGEAEQAFRESIQCDEKYADPWNGLGNLLTQHTTRHDEAEQAYRKAIQCDEKSALPWNGLGNLLTNHLQRYDEAGQAYREAIQRDDQWAYPWYGLGNLLTQHTNRYDEAEQAYREAIQRDDKLANPWYGLGNLLANDHLQRYGEAEQAYREAIQRDEKWAYPWNGLGNLLIRQERYAEAEQAFRQAIALAEEKTDLYLNLAELGLITDNDALTQEGLEGATNSAQTHEEQITLVLMQLAYAIQQQDLSAIESTHNALLAHKTANQIGLNWNFDDQAPFIERLSIPAANLYQAWLDAFSKDAQKRQQADPQAAFDAWHASVEQP